MTFKQRPVTNFIVIHCSATDPEWHGPVSAEDIDQWHRSRGWTGIGYHFYIRRSGTIEIGRPLSAIGAHVAGHNSESIGICLEGGVIKAPDGRGFIPSDNYTPNQWKSLRAIVEACNKAYPQATVQGHRDFPGVTKACPSFDVKSWLEQARGLTE